MPKRRCIVNGYRGCSDGGYAVPGTSRCRAHSRRSGWGSRAPVTNLTNYRSGWQAVRPRVFERDGYQCQLRFPGICIGKASEVDHIIQPVDGGTDDMENLRAVCRPCHARRTGRQGAIAKQRAARRRAARGQD